MNADVTQRGFTKAVFTDRYGVECSIQESSLATEGAIWLGVEESNPRYLVPGQGWAPYEYPEGFDIHTDTRMHLTQDHVKRLLPVMQHFARTGYLPEVEDGMLMTQSVRWRLAAREFGLGWRTYALMGTGWLLGTGFAYLAIAHVQHFGSL